VHRWGIDIQEGIFDMLQLLIDLIATRLRYEPVPVDLLHVLAMVYSDCLFVDSDYLIYYKCCPQKAKAVMVHTVRLLSFIIWRHVCCKLAHV